MNPQVSIPKTCLASFCRTRGIKRLAVFGSALRSDFGPESDIDLLVEFEPGCEPGLLKIVRMERELADLLRRDVDLVTRSAIERSRNYIRRSAILESAVVVYAK